MSLGRGGVLGGGRLEGRRGHPVHMSLERGRCVRRRERGGEKRAPSPHVSGEREVC